LPPRSAAFTLRPATADDAAAIRALIRRVRINPLGLHWQRFIVAVSPRGEVIACGQVKPHGDGSRELASIAVAPEWRGLGAARAIITQLVAAHPPPLYLTCRAGLTPFYLKFGFRPIAEAEMPPYFRRLSRLFGLMRPWLDEGLTVMVRQAGSDSALSPADETPAQGRQAHQQ